MLKGIPSVLTPELLKILAEMGHGDELVIGDSNFPAQSKGKRCIRADGHSGTEMLDAILKLFPLDTFVDTPVGLMAADPGTIDSPYPPIWDEYKAIVEKHQPGTKCEEVNRFDFYDRTEKAYAAVSTGETQPYGCIIIRKGCC